MTDLLVVGAGPFGLTVARQLAEAGRRVALIDKRNHIGGNCHSAVDDQTGIEVHPFGAHIFHTSNQRVWDYIRRFTSFTSYQHRVWITHNAQVYPMPINLATINQFYSAAYSPAQARALIQDQVAQATTAKSPTGAGQAAQGGLDAKGRAMLGPDLYQAFIRGYTAKQWDTDPALLPAATISRLPVRYNYDSRYFSDPHQGMPTNGYYRLWQRLADHHGIDVHLETDFFDPSSRWFQDATVGQLPIVYTGPVDRFFSYGDGVLGWRTIDLAWDHPVGGDYQGCAVMNFADLDVPHTRIIEFRHFHPERDYPGGQTVIATESSRLAGPNDEPYYPIGSPADSDCLAQYRRRAEALSQVHFGGRLGRYQYLDMDTTIAAALGLADQLAAAGNGRGNTA
ncbi:MAG: FAD-dependent oxidoreductase [Micrococcales bacterium]|nr:FAD-dependent oxidoreductase [Micrococcales bacterium]